MRPDSEFFAGKFKCGISETGRPAVKGPPGWLEDAYSMRLGPNLLAFVAEVVRGEAERRREWLRRAEKWLEVADREVS